MSDLSDDEYLIQHENSNISKIDVALMIFFWLISTWGYVAQYLINDEEGHISDVARYWIGMTIPISTSTAALFKSIQVGMEIKTEHRERRIRAERNITNNFNINAGSADVDLTVAGSVDVDSTPKFLAENKTIATLKLTNPKLVASAPILLAADSSGNIISVDDILSHSAGDLKKTDE